MTKDMNRRKFLANLGVLVGGVAIQEVIPFNRVWFFPTDIVIPKFYPLEGGTGLRPGDVIYEHVKNAFLDYGVLDEHGKTNVFLEVTYKYFGGPPNKLDDFHAFAAH